MKQKSKKQDSKTSPQPTEKAYSLRQIAMRSILQKSWVQCAPEKSERRGRKVSTPETGFDPMWFGLDAMADDFRKVLRRFDCPENWETELPFMIGCLVYPERVDGATLKDGKVTLQMKRHDKTRWKVATEVLHALKFAHLYAESPAKFLRVMFELGYVMEKKSNSPKMQAAMLHAALPDAGKRDASEVARRLNTVDNPTTGKTVEHARRLLRGRKPFSKP